jgi:hypothetical protein
LGNTNKMSIRVGVVGIDLRKLKGEFGSQALQSSGNNLETCFLPMRFITK